jgi:hypothetical protein
MKKILFHFNIFFVIKKARTFILVLPFRHGAHIYSFIYEGIVTIAVPVSEATGGREKIDSGYSSSLSRPPSSSYPWHASSHQTVLMTGNNVAGAVLQTRVNFSIPPFISASTLTLLLLSMYPWLSSKGK